jgi:hypothetical protein
VVGQIAFPLLLYGFGLFPALFLRGRIPVSFLAGTAFAWGAFLWAFVSVAFLWLPLDYSAVGVGVTVAAIVALATVVGRRRVPPSHRVEVRDVAAGALIFLVVLVLASYLRISGATTDSFFQIVLANEWAAGRMNGDVLGELGYWGVVLAALHAAAPSFGADYFATIPTAAGLTLVSGFYFLCKTGLMATGWPAWRARPAAALATLYLGSSHLIAYQFVYIHNNLIAAMYLLLAAGTLWLAHSQSSREYLWLSVLAFLAFAMTRTETALYAVVFLVPAISVQHFPRKTWLHVLLPFTVYLTAWNLWLLIVVRPDTHILTSDRLLIIIAGVLGLYTAAAAAGVTFVQRWVTPRLHRAMLAGFILILVIIAFLQPFHLPRIMGITVQNLVLVGIGWWGLVWWFVVICVFLVVPRSPLLPYERLLITGIAGFILLLLVISYAHGFRIGPGDSGNRTFVHLLPVVLFYLTLKTAPYLCPDQSEGVTLSKPSGTATRDIVKCCGSQFLRWRPQVR